MSFPANPTHLPSSLLSAVQIASVPPTKPLRLIIGRSNLHRSEFPSLSLSALTYSSLSPKFRTTPAFAPFPDDFSSASFPPKSTNTWRKKKLPPHPPGEMVSPEIEKKNRGMEEGCKYAEKQEEEIPFQGRLGDVYGFVVVFLEDGER